MHEYIKLQSYYYEYSLNIYDLAIIIIILDIIIKLNGTPFENLSQIHEVIS